MKKIDIRFIVIILGIACMALLIQSQMSRGKAWRYVCIYVEQIDGRWQVDKSELFRYKGYF